MDAQSPHRANSPLSGLLNQRLIVCIGNGGVGKTTVAAAIALLAALRRRDTAVITVDPARRLQDALGLDSGSNDPQPVPLGDQRGRLDALALDTKSTFDRLIARVSPTAEVADRIQANRLYQHLSNELGGSADYMAMETLHELLQQARYQLIVVDTPPGVHARDLLSAPLRITTLLTSNAVRILKTPVSLLFGSDTRVGRITMRVLLKLLERWTGAQLLRELSDFAINFEPLVDGFRSRALKVEQALHQHDTSFVLVTSPEPDTITATIEFDRELRNDGFVVTGIIANRVLDFAGDGLRAAAVHPEPLRGKLVANYAAFATLAERDRRALARLQQETTTPLLAILPMLDENPASLLGLQRLAERLEQVTRTED